MISSTFPVREALPTQAMNIHVHVGHALEAHFSRWHDYVLSKGASPLSRHPAWLNVLRKGLRHEVYCLEAVEGGAIRGILPLAHVRSVLFGRFLVSLPYLNYGGVHADDDLTACRLIDRAAQLADELGVRYLELRQEQPIEHPKFSQRMTSKVHMRLTLPAQSELLWKALSAKVRNQVRKGQKSGLSVAWGGQELLAEFHAVFSQNMRDLGTPTYGKKFFSSIVNQFPERAEFCLVRSGETSVAGALLLHGWGITEVPSASSLRAYNHTCANMLMYWHLLERSIERGQQVFDFGRSSRDSSTHRFKEQWGAKEAASEWQYYLRKGSISEMRPENPKYQRMIRIWQRLPVTLTRWIGPSIVRGIP